MDGGGVAKATHFAAPFPEVPLQAHYAISQ